MSAILLNLDGGEHDSEPVALYALADVVHVACGGHAGDEASMRRVAEACLEHGTRIGAHPSYVDREGFGRRTYDVEESVLAAQVEEQCAALRRVVEELGGVVTSAKPHGALYHAAHADPAVARACVTGIERALGKVVVVGLADGALAVEARRRGLAYWREAFADRGVRADGTLVPRGEPGAVLDDPREAARRAQALVASGAAETLCVHGDTPAALVIARAVYAVLHPGSGETRIDP